MKDPQWEKPVPLGYAASADAAHFVAAPLLAGGAVALLGVIAADHDKFRLPEATMLVLTLAVITLVASVQFGFQARQWLYSAADVTTWWGEEDLPEREMQRQGHAVGWWSSAVSATDRVEDARDRHFDDCPAAEFDPKKLTKMSEAELEAAIAELATNDADVANGNEHADPDRQK